MIGRPYGKVNEHNGWIPRDFWLEDWERKAIIDFHLGHPPGRVSALGFYDDGRRRGRCQSEQCLAGFARGRVLEAVERQALEKGDGVCGAVSGP